MSRLAAIALAIRERAPHVRTPFLIEGSSHFLLESIGIPFVSVPNRDDFQTGSWEPWATGERLHLVSAMAGAAIRSFAPSVIVFDSFPLPAAVEIAIQLGLPAVLVVRKMLDMPGYFQQIELFAPYLKLVLFPHDLGEFEVPSWLVSRSRFCGRIVRPARIHTTPRQPDTPKRIVVSGGGGGYPGTVEFYNAALAAIASCEHRRGLDATLVTGPLFDEWSRLRLVENVKVLPFVTDMPSLLAGADLVLCEAGYNTIAELLQVGTTAIVVPALRGGDNQFERAEQAAAGSPVIRVWHALSEARLDRMMDECLEAPSRRNVPEFISTPGAGIAAGAILECAALPQPVHNSVQS